MIDKFDFSSDEDIFDVDIEDIDVENIVDIDGVDDIDSNAPMEYVYYLVGDRPLRISYIAPGIAVLAEILDSDTKEFVTDNFYIHYVAESTDIIELDQKEFVDECLKRGTKPLK